MTVSEIPLIPVATYRLQFRNGMTFDRAVGLIPHWKSLGISHLYASPVFSAVAGSTHGYDVTDPNEIDPSLGGMDGLRRLSDALLASGLGLILDIVPNHVAASLENPHWREVLKWGEQSQASPIFDNHWDQRLTLPVLDRAVEDVISEDNGKLVWLGDRVELVFDYHGSPYPLAPSTWPLALKPEFRTPELERLAQSATPGDSAALNAWLATHLAQHPASLVTDTDDIIQLLDRQSWQMIHWRDAASGLSYRRFFEITGLVGIRVEDPAVFEATHRTILALVAEGRVQGLRLDHIDGLADPAGYLGRLRAAVGPDIHIVVEKILEGHEQLPPDWPIAGTTGYEFIADIAGLLTKPSPELDDAWRAIAPDFGAPDDELMRAKRLMVEVNFEGEVTALARRARAIADLEGQTGLTDAALLKAVQALVAGFEVYRIYATPDGIGEQDRQVLSDLFERLGTTAPDLQTPLVFLRAILLDQTSDITRPSAHQFRTRLQHLTGPVLAKSLEDTFFYRYNRLIALNEVGGDPMAENGGIAHFHRRMAERLARQKHGLSASSTHDTKRGEDARARLYAISEAPEDWTALCDRWRQTLAGNVTPLPDGPAPEPAVEWLLFQSLAGALPDDFDPTDEDDRAELTARFLPYVEKALREAKLRTNWSAVDEAYEAAVRDYAQAALGSQAFMTAFCSDIDPFMRTGRVNSLAQTALKLTAPGIPDIYQGTEGVDVSLVDPDNRRMPDFTALVVAAGNIAYETAPHPPASFGPFSPSGRGEGRWSAASATSPLAPPAGRGWRQPGEGRVAAEPTVTTFPATKTHLTATLLHLRQSHQSLFAEGDYLPLETTGLRHDHIVAFARRHGDTSILTIIPRLIHRAIAETDIPTPDWWGDTAIVLPEDITTLGNMLDGTVLNAADGRLQAADVLDLWPVAVLRSDTHAAD